MVLSYIRHIFELPMSFFSTRRTGEIISRFTDANSIIDALASTIMSLFLDGTTVLVVGTVMGFQNGALLLLALVALPVYIIIVFAFLKPFERLNNETMQANAVVSSSIIEDINGVETIKSLVSEQEQYGTIDREFVEYLDKSFSYAKAEAEALQTSLKTAAQLLLNVAVLWYGAGLVMDNTISLGQFITFNTLLEYFTQPLLTIINLQSKLKAARVANTRLNEVFLTITHVSYKYGSGKNTLTDVSVTFPQGSKTAVVGMSGSGKTTLAKLLVNFYDMTEGSIRVGSVDVSQVDRSILRRHINYLSQDPYIFSGTIAQNLLLGSKPGTTQEDVERAVEIAEVRGDIETMAMGYETELTTDAAAISGGQKQRIALARALLSDAPVMILDEATSNLDTVTERRIVDNLLALTDKTIIFVAHRLSIANRCDSIVMLDHGEIVEQGSPAQLMTAQGAYYRLTRGEGEAHGNHAV